MAQVAANTEWSGSGMPESAEDQSGLEILMIAWRRKWLIALVTLIGLGLGYLYFSQATPIYSSEAQILLIKKQANLPMAGQQGQTFNYEDELATHMILICSPMIVSQAVETDHLELLPSLQTPEGAEQERDPVATIIGSLTAEQGEDTESWQPHVIVLSYVGTNPEDCQTILNSVIVSYEAFLDKTYNDFSAETVNLITKAKDELSRQISEKGAAYLVFRSEAPLVWTGEEGRSPSETRLADLELARSKMIVENAEREARVKAVEDGLDQDTNPRTLLQLMEKMRTDELGLNPSLMQLGERERLDFEREIHDLRIEEREKLQEFGADHPEVLAIRAKLELKQKYLETLPEVELLEPAELVAANLEAIRLELAIGQGRLADYNSFIEQERATLQEQTNFFLADENLRREIDNLQGVFDGIVDRLGAINLNQDYGGINTQLIAPPALGAVVGPILLKIMAISCLLGLFAGSGLAYLIDLADGSFRTPQDVRKQLGLPIVGHIPIVDGSSQARARKNGTATVGEMDPTLCTYHRPKGRPAEAYRAVRTSLLFDAHSEHLKVIQVTSPNPGDGKTTLATNLAVSIANSGKRVLLLDCDFRRPRIHKYFGLDGLVGLTSVINGEAEIPEATKETPVENLEVIPCGPKPQNPADMLSSRRFQELLDLVREEYDFVIVDSPPLLAVTDPTSIAPRMDAVLLVMRLTKHARQNTTRAIEMLDSLGARTLGLVINGIGKRTGFGKSYRYNGYGYRYNGYGYGGYHYAYGYKDRNGNGDHVYYADDAADEQRPMTKSSTST